MKTYVPNYYDDFACLMGGCRHSCCIGWEIDIDSDALAYYRSIGGEIGRKLKENIASGGDGGCFRMTEDERCPFLNEGGLCELILELGGDSLCQICADHPRFRNFFSNREEIGLGLCCEAVGRLILKSQAPFSLRILEDDGLDEAIDDDEAELLELRGMLIDAMQNRSLSLPERIARMLDIAGISLPAYSIANWAGFMLNLERLDDRWAEHLSRLQAYGKPLPGLPASPEWETAFEQLTVYLLYRHLPGALEDGDIRGRIAFAVLVVRLLHSLCRIELAHSGGIGMDDLTELARMYSSEIEYSDENIDAILTELHRLVPDL